MYVAMYVSVYACRYVCMIVCTYVSCADEKNASLTELEFPLFLS